MATELTDMDIEFISTVDRGANKRTHALLKRDQRAGGRMTIAQGRFQKALESGIAKGHGQKGGVVAAIKKLLAPKHRVAKSARDNISTITWALDYVTAVLEDEAADAAEGTADGDAAEDAKDVSTLRQAADLLGQYITATAAEVGTPDDLEDVAEEAAAYARAMQSYYPVYMRDGGADLVAKAGKKQFSAARLARLEEAADAFASVLAEVKAESTSDDDEDEETTKRAQPEEDDMITKDDIAAVAKAVGDALEPRFAGIEKRLPAEGEAVEKGAGAAAGATAGDGSEPVAITKAEWDGVKTVLEKLLDGQQTQATSRAVRKSLDGQEGESSNGKVDKSVFAGILG